MMTVEPETSRREQAIVGSLLGTAVGDALGLPYEGVSPRRAERMLGPPDRHRLFLGRGMISDDTEHSCLVAESLIAAKQGGGFVNEFTWRLRNWVRFVPAGVGLATLRACLKLNLGVGPDRSGVFSAGNGPAMRSAILGAAVDDTVELCELICVSSRVTHIDRRAEAGALAIALAARSAAADQEVHPSTFVNELQELCSPHHSGELVDLLRRAMWSVEQGESTQQFARSIGVERGVSGYVNHTVPIALHACWSHPTDFRAAVDSVIRCGGDTDTTAAIVGGIVGARVGKDGIPGEWLGGVRDWPRSVAWIEALGRELASGREGRAAAVAPTLSPVAILSRNICFAGVVLFHGFRRLFPPY